MNKQTRILFTLCTLVTLFASTFSSLIFDENPINSAAEKVASNSLTFLGNTEPKIGGLHDYIFKKDRKSLIKWAITAEAHYFIQSKLNNEEPYEAFIYNRISELSDADLAKYVLTMANKYPELNSSSALDTLSARYGITDEIVNFVSINKNANEIKQKNESEFNNNNEHNSKNSAAAASPSKKLIKKNPKALHNVLNSGDRQTLIKWALTAEAQLHNGKPKISGGMHDYIHTLTNEQIQKYISIAAKTHSELNSKEKMEQLAEKYGITDELAFEKHAKGEPEAEKEAEEEFDFSSEKNEEHKEKENLHDVIAEGGRKLLIKWALVAEALLNQGAQGKLIGGLHDYVHSLSNEQLGKFISVAAKNHAELNSKEKMEMLAQQFNIGVEEQNEKEKAKENEKIQNKLLNKRNFNFNLFMSEQKDDLFSWALAAESYEKEKLNLLSSTQSGLESYIMHLNKEQLVDFLVNKVTKYPQLADKNYLEYLARRFGYKKF